MSNLVIVALPKEDELVNRLSSEQVPHMTLLFLGENDETKSLDEILSFTEHTVNTSLTQFGIEVEYRGILGPDKTDVLFFSKAALSGFDIINSFRSKLLTNNGIRTAYDSVDQFPEWIPHLTLGYPESPANPDTRFGPAHNLFKQQINFILFDRIAVWTEDYAGTEFPLQLYNFDKAVHSILSHDNLYDPVKAHEYYVRTRQLKGRHKGSKTTKGNQPNTKRSATYTVQTKNGTHRLSATQLEEQQVYAAKRVADITNRLNELSDKLKKMLQSAQKKSTHTQTASTSAARARRNRQSRKNQQRHKETLAAKAKTRRQVLGSTKKVKSTTHKDPVATLEKKITEVRDHLKAAVATQRALSSAVKNG